MVATTTKSTLHQALTSDRADVGALMSHSVLLDEASATPFLRMPMSPGAYWHQLVAALLETRHRRHPGMGAHSSCYERLVGWSDRLHELGQQTPGPLRRHLVAFTDLPLRLTSLLLVVGDYGVWRDAEAASAALEISEWMLARTLLVASDARAGVQRDTATVAKEIMLSKIIESGPTDFWRLCRRYDRQDKAIHEPALHVLMEEKRIRLNPEGRLVAA